MTYKIPLLPPVIDIETKAVLKRATAAHRSLAELKGKAASIPNESILINTLALQEAKDSSAIENIITTYDELYKVQLFEELIHNASAKEVSNYAEALKHGFELVKKNKILSVGHILKIQSILEQNDAGFRRVPGTALVNQATGESVYTPPQDNAEIVVLMENLVQFINDSIDNELDPLVKMAIIHHQFESIHPFYDGNGRTGRIINILYLVVQDLLDLPILYLSRYIIDNKADYYRLLQQVRDTGNWEEWLLYILAGVEETAKETIYLIAEIKKLMHDFKKRLRLELPKIYSQDLLNNLFRHPYTKIEFLTSELMISRLTASKYADQLVEKGFLEKQRIGRSNFYVNAPLYALFKGQGDSKKHISPIQTINPSFP